MRRTIKRESGGRGDIPPLHLMEAGERFPPLFEMPSKDLLSVWERDPCPVTSNEGSRLNSCQLRIRLQGNSGQRSTNRKAVSQ